MTFAPLINASLVIQIHTFLAVSSVVLTFTIFAFPKGTPLHRALGRIWVGAMALVALSSFFISELRMIGPFSPIHALSIFVLYSLYEGIRAARAGDIRKHRRTMKGLVFGALMVAGAFTFLPGRVMYLVVTGG